MLWTTVILWLALLPHTECGCSRSCVCYHQYIDCSSRQLTTIPTDLSSQVSADGIFKTSVKSDNTEIISLNLAHNQIEEAPTHLFSEMLPRLKSLDLSNNRILEITNIQSVVLSKQLYYFRIASNPIHHLGFNSDTVLYSASISYLDVSNCAISSITSPATFMYLLNLTRLDLSGNPLVVVDHLASHTLGHLDLSRCLLGLHDRGIREETFVNLPKLQFLNLSHNSHLTRFPLSTTLSSSLSYLQASDCALEKMDLGPFPNLQKVDLKGNVIKILHNNMLVKNGQLKMLDVSKNSIHHIEDYAFMGGQQLRYLDLSSNLLSGLNWYTFSQTTGLVSLNLSRNLLTSLEEIPIPSLYALDISKCEITNISPRFLTKAQNLKYLNLSHNSIESLPKIINRHKLEHLDLSYCRISDVVNGNFESLPSLKTLNLMGNRMTVPMKESLLKHLANLNELNLVNNPWHCDCNDSDFRELWQLVSSHPTKHYLRDLLCHSPREHAGLTWEKSCFEGFHAKDERRKTHTAWISFLTPIVTLCCLTAILVVIRQAYLNHAAEIQQQHTTNRSTSNQRRSFSPRIAPHFFDDELERGIHMSVNESTQQSPIRELSKLPSYEEALLLPKVETSHDLQSIIKKYEETDRFESAASGDARTHDMQHTESSNQPSTSGQST